jgi:hypothetical protein
VFDSTSGRRPKLPALGPFAEGAPSVLMSAIALP